MTSAEKETGMVKVFDHFKGYGFITREKGKDVFFFYDDIATNDTHIFPGDYVSFYLKQEPKGPRAYDVKKIK